MIALQLANVKLVLGAHVLFNGLSWEIQHDQKVGLIGPNGAGKSSLFKLMTAEYNPEPGGMITRARGISLGYLPQHPELPMDRTPIALAMEGNPRVAEVAASLQEVEASLGETGVYSNPGRLEKALARQQQLLEEYASFGGDGYSQRVHNLLISLGLPETDLEKPLSLLSGGQKKLVGLARLLMAAPSLLLLDEPDNHLDLPGKVYLEQLIREYPGAVVIISHDRYLLDACVTHIAEIEDGRLVCFSGDYSSYMLEKEERLARQQQMFEAQAHEIRRMQAAIKRLALWGKLYDNEKFAKRAKSMQIRLEKIEKIERPIMERKRMDLELNGWRGSSKVLELRGLAKAFGSRQVLQPTSLTVRHGERVGLIGPNGAGKSVLLRLILGMEAPDQGDVILGPSVKVGYYAQEHETLDFKMTLIESVRRAAALNESSAVSFLLRYLFTYRQASQMVGELSGGERSRLQLAMLVLSGANFLLLDEPTNNLDIASAEVLEQALDEFEGTVLVISHDRYFLDRTIQKILALEGGRLVEYLGGYSDYLERKGSEIG